MFVRSRGVLFGFAEKMFTFCSAKSRKDVFSEDDFIYEHWLVITASLEDLAAVVFVSNKFVFLCNLSCYCKRNFPASFGLFANDKSA